MLSWPECKQAAAVTGLCAVVRGGCAPKRKTRALFMAKIVCERGDDGPPVEGALRSAEQWCACAGARGCAEKNDGVALCAGVVWCAQECAGQCAPGLALRLNRRGRP